MKAKRQVSRRPVAAGRDVPARTARRGTHIDHARLSEIDLLAWGGDDTHARRREQWHREVMRALGLVDEREASEVFWIDAEVSREGELSFTVLQASDGKPLTETLHIQSADDFPTVSEFIRKSLKPLGESKKPPYTDGNMDIEAVIRPAAEIFGLTEAELTEAANQYKAAKAETTARETTTRAPVELRADVSVQVEPPSPETATPGEVAEAAAETTERGRPKWKPDLGLTAAHFAAQAYAPEIANGTFDKSLVRREDRTLYRLLFREKAWGELAALTETSIPTKSERRLAEQIQAVREMGLPVEEVERVVAGIKEARAQAHRLAQKLPLG
jgi:hypothetical protein